MLWVNVQRLSLELYGTDSGQVKLKISAGVIVIHKEKNLDSCDNHGHAARADWVSVFPPVV